MTKPLPRQSVFRLTAEELHQVEKALDHLNSELERRGADTCREDSQLLVVGNVSAFVLDEVASRFQVAGYLVEVILANRGGPALIRLK